MNETGRTDPPCGRCSRDAGSPPRATDAAAAETAFRLAVKKLDQAAAHHLIHKNVAARTKSRLSRLLKKTAS